MRCIFAVLYLRGTDSIMSDRLVIMSAGQYPSYGVYIPPGKQFPSPNVDSDITVTNNNLGDSGTFNALYCSPSLHTSQIVESITASLSPLPPFSLCPPDPSHIQAKTCSSRITHLSNQKNPVKLYKMSQVLEGNMCTLSQFISLVRDGTIMPAGLYTFDAPTPRDALLYVSTDRRIKVSELLMSNQVFKTLHENNWHILAWSQGHLHLFREDEASKYWTKITKYGAEEKNAAKIIDFLVSFNLMKYHAKATPQDERVQMSAGLIDILSYAYTQFKNRHEVRYDSQMIKKISPDRLMSNFIPETSAIELIEPMSDANILANLKISNAVRGAVNNYVRDNH